ncbi:MAG TPA: hypothetical protein ENI61_05120 [Ignavibacteria bacterium]|nr:hypothetical protein [Ignavibacteria bacterium]
MTKRIIVESRDDYMSRLAIRKFLRYGFPVILAMGGYANYNSYDIFRYVAWLGTLWFILAFTPQIIKLIKKKKSRR